MSDAARSHSTTHVFSGSPILELTGQCQSHHPGRSRRTAAPTHHGRAHVNLSTNPKRRMSDAVSALLTKHDIFVQQRWYAQCSRHQTGENVDAVCTGLHLGCYLRCSTSDVTLHVQDQQRIMKARPEEKPSFSPLTWRQLLAQHQNIAGRTAASIEFDVGQEKECSLDRMRRLWMAH